MNNILISLIKASIAQGGFSTDWFLVFCFVDAVRNDDAQIVQLFRRVRKT